MGNKPVTFLGYGQCKICKSNIAVVESETDSFQLNEDGMAINHKVERFSIKGYCPTCNRELYLVKEGMVYREEPTLKYCKDKLNKKQEKNRDDIPNPLGKDI